MLTVSYRPALRPGSTSSMDASDSAAVDDDDIVGPMDMSDSPDPDSVPLGSEANKHILSQRWRLLTSCHPCPTPA